MLKKPYKWPTGIGDGRRGFGVEKKINREWTLFLQSISPISYQIGNQ